MGLFDKIKENIAKQEVAQEKHEAALERASLHEEIQRQKEYEEKQKRLEKIKGNLTQEEKELLARRKARLEEAKKKNAERYAKLQHAAQGLFSSGMSMYKSMSHTRTRRHKKRR